MDVELFISEVEKWPAIWNIKDPKHSNRDFMGKCWAEVPEIMQSQDFYQKIVNISVSKEIFESKRIWVNDQPWILIFLLK